MAFLARALLFLPVCRYVDDFHSIESEGCVEVAAHVFVRLCRLLLGHCAIAEKDGRLPKVQFGNPINLLGLKVSATTSMIWCQLTEAKCRAWAAVLREALHAECMPAAVAKKMAGRLTFAIAVSLGKVGLAFVRPFFAQANRPLLGGKASHWLLASSQWCCQY